MLGIVVFLAVCHFYTVTGSTDQKCAPTFSPWESKNRDCSSCRSEYENYCPKTCGLGGYCCRKSYGGCPYGANEASPDRHTCVTFKDDITEDQWALMKKEYKKCVDNIACEGCLKTVKMYLPILLQAGKIGPGEVGEHYSSSDDFNFGKSYMAQWGRTLKLRKGDNIIKHVTVNESVTIDGHVNGIEPAGGKWDYGNYRMRYRPIGLYAPAGEIVTITVPEEMVGKLEVVIGITEFNEYTIYNYPPVNSRVMKIASPWGGLIILRLTERDAIKGFFEAHGVTEFDVIVNNALRAPTFIYNKHSNEQWKNTLRNYAPNWAVLSIPGQVAIYVQTIKISSIDNMQTTMDKIKKTMDLLQEMMGIDPSTKPGAEIWIFNPGRGGGWRGGGNCRPAAAIMGEGYADEFFKQGAEGVTLHEAGHGFCYWGLPSNGGQWTAETVRSYIEYKLGIFDDPIKKDLMDSPNLDFDLMYRMVSFDLYSNGKACGRARFNSKQLKTSSYDVCWKWLSWIPEKAHGWNVYKEVNTLLATSKTSYRSRSDRMIDMYCQATKHNMLQLFTDLYNLQPAGNIKENCEKLPKSELIGKWLNIVKCVKESMTTGAKDIRKCAKLPHFPKHEGLCVLSGECQNDEANGGKTTTMKNKFDLYGSTGPWLSKKLSADKEMNCLKRAMDYFKDCKNKDDQKVTATFYKRNTEDEVSYTHPPLVRWKQISDRDCWSPCKKKGGPCPSFCGPDAYCCRDGYDGCPMASYGASPSKHTCVTDKPISEATWRQKDGADCWYKCGRKGGPCPNFCGSKGFCCRKGYGGCPLGAAEKSPKHHTCVLKQETGKK